jgi:putative Holliday junction resolvase
MVLSRTMKIISSQDFNGSLPPNAKLLGLDVGTKTIGLAFGDVATRICTPLKVITRGKLKADAAELLKQINEYRVSGLVVGWPLNVDGTEGRRCQGVKDVILAMQDYLPLDLPVTFWDERFSTADAQSFLITEIDMSRKRRGQVIDKMAALEILTSYLDYS